MVKKCSFYSSVISSTVGTDLSVDCLWAGVNTSNIVTLMAAADGTRDSLLALGNGEGCRLLFKFGKLGSVADGRRVN